MTPPVVAPSDTSTTIETQETSTQTQNLVDAFDELMSSDDSVISSGTEAKVGIGFNDILGKLSPDERQVLANIRASYQRKVNEATKTKKQYEDQRRSLLESMQGTDFLKNLNAEATASVEFDPYDATSIEKLVDRKAAEKFSSYLKAAQAEQSKVTERINAERALESVRAKFFDFDTYEEKVIELLDTITGDPTTRLERAYKLAKYDVDMEGLSKKSAELDELRKMSQAAGLKVSGGRISKGRASIPDEVRKRAVNDPVAMMHWIQSQQ